MKVITEVNTDNIRKVIDTLENYSKYYLNKREVFDISNYQTDDYDDISAFNGLLKKIKSNYNDISNNINNIVSYMQEYCNDIEGLENKVSEKGGIVKESNASIVASKISMSIDSSSVNDTELFEINTYNEQSSNTQEMSKYMSKFIEETDKRISDNEIINTSDEEVGKATKISKIGNVLKSLLSFIDSKVETPELVIDDKVYNETYQEYTNPLESQKTLMKQYISAVDEELKEYETIENEFSRAKYHLRTIDDISMLSKESQKVIKEKFGTLEDYKKYISELKELKTSCETNIEQIEQNIDVAKYECLTVLSDYDKYQNKDKVDSSKITIENVEGVNYFTSYEEYCKRYGQVSELEYARGLEERISKLSNEAYSVDDHTKQLLNLIHVAKTDETYSKIYNYLNDKYGAYEANEYLKVIENTVNQAIGKEKAQAYLNTLSKEENIKEAITNHLKVTGKGIDSGIQSSASGIEHAISAAGAFITGESPSRANTIEEYENMYLSQALASGDYTGAYLKDNYAISQGIGNMAPSIALSMAGGGAIGSALLGISAGGNSYHEMLTEGYTNSQALTYGVISGATESITEKFLGGISFFNDVPVDSFKSYIHSMAKEGLEEGGQEIFGEGVKSLITGEKIDGNELKGNVIQSALYGGITAGILNTPSMIANTKFSRQQDISNDLQVLEDNDILKRNLSSISKKTANKYEQLFVDIENEINSQAKFSMSDILFNTLSIFQKLIYTDVKNNSQLSSEIVKNGLYHFTTEENAMKILQSGYVKKSNYVISYGKEKSFFFNGIPDIADVAINLPSITQTQVAVKFDVSESMVSDFRYRAYDDGAVTYDGNYNFDRNTARLVYLALQFDENNKLVYKEVSKPEYDMINNAARDMKSLNIFNDKLRTLKSCSIGFAKQTEYFLNNINNLYSKAADLTNTGATIVNSKINSILNLLNPNLQFVDPNGITVSMDLSDINESGSDNRLDFLDITETMSITKTFELDKNSSKKTNVIKTLDLNELFLRDRDASNIRYEESLPNSVKSRIFERINTNYDSFFYNALTGFYGVDQDTIGKHINIEIKNFDWLNNKSDFIKFLINNYGFNSSDANTYLNKLLKFKKKKIAYDFSANEGIILTDYFFDKCYRENRYDIIDLFDNSFVFYYDDNIKRLHSKLMNYGMEHYDALRVLCAINSTGVCSYAAVANQILYAYKGNYNAFEKDFGYPMYINIDGNVGLNTSELLLDMYTHINSNRFSDSLYKGNLFYYDINGNLHINNLLTENQVFLGNSDGTNLDAINSFLQSKNPNLKFVQSDFKRNSDYTSLADLKEAVANQLLKPYNNTIVLDVYRTKSTKKPLRFIDESGNVFFSTYNWNEGAGHAVCVTGMNDYYFIVSSWGERLFIPIEDLINNVYDFGFNRVEGIE